MGGDRFSVPFVSIVRKGWVNMLTCFKNRKIKNYMFMLPALLIYLSVIVVPVFYSIYISLQSGSGIGKTRFVGLANYLKVIEDPVFLTALKNNFIWIVLTVFLTTTVSLLLAVLLNTEFKGRTLFRAIFYFPCAVAPIAVAIIWRWMYDPNVGFFNEFFKLIGSGYRQQWLSSPAFALLALFYASLWQAIGQPMILFLAGLQTVSGDVLEAASIDGAKAIQKFFFITLPLLKETLIMVLATLLIAAMKVYDIVKGLTDGGPNNKTQMLSTYMYSQTFEYNNVGYGTTIAVIMVLLMLVVIIPYIIFTAKED